jgi:HPt (histidine-containing phosphotransfer) domain-containing protein
MEQLNTSSMGLTTLRTSLLHTFLGDVDPRMRRLGRAIEQGDARRIEFETHGLRGMCATIGATGCVTYFGEMERLARDDRSADARPLWAPAEAEVERTREYINRLEQIVKREAA